MHRAPRRLLPGPGKAASGGGIGGGLGSPSQAVVTGHHPWRPRGAVFHPAWSTLALRTRTPQPLAAQPRPAVAITGDDDNPMMEPWYGGWTSADGAGLNHVPS